MKLKLKISILSLLILAIVMTASYAPFANASSPDIKEFHLPEPASQLEEIHSDQQFINLYIPMFYNEESGYTSSLLINNLENTPATIFINGTTEEGSTFDFFDTIPANGSATYAQHPNIPSGFRGAIVISSDRQITAMSTVSDTDFRAFATYVGQDTGSLNLYMPLLPYAPADEATLFSLQNIGSSNANVTISYNYGNSPSVSATIQPNAPAFFDVNLEDLSSTAVSANITSDQPLVAAVLIPQNRETFSAYTVLHSGTTTPFFPLLQRGGEASLTGIWLQNIGDQMTEVTLEYMPSLNGEPCEETVPIVPNSIGFLTRNWGPCESDNFLGSTRIKANSTNQPLVGLVRQLSAEGGIDIYNAFDATEAMNGIFVPLIMDRNNGWHTTLAVQHIGGPPATITCHFSDTAYELTADLEVGASLIDSQKYKVRDSYEGSAFCLADNDETRIAAVVTQLSASDVMVYEGTSVDAQLLPPEYNCSTATVTCPVEEPLIIPTNVTINGPTSGTINTTYTFQAQVTPDNVTQPFTHQWQADGQAPINQEGGGIDAVAYTWDEPGVYTITVTTSNVGGSVSAVHEINITQPSPPVVGEIEVEIAGNSGPARFMDDGTVIVTFIRLFVADFSIKLNVTCSDGTAPTAVFLDAVTNGTTTSFPMLDSATSPNSYIGGISRLDTPPDNSTLNIRAACPSGNESINIGAIRLYDPMGRVTDAITGQPITGATVTLHHVPGWSPRTSPSDSAPNTCESNLSKDADAPWSQPAPIDQGIVIDRESTLISPPTSSKSTDINGAYGWDVSEGCWYVRVTAAGYAPITSAVVGMPTAVTDLDLALRPTLTSSVTPANATAQPGGVVEARLRLFNDHSGPMAVDLSQANIPGWAVQGLPETATIEANSELDFPFSIMVSTLAQPGTTHTISVMATSLDDPNVQAESRVVVQIESDDVTQKVYLPVISR